MKKNKMCGDTIVCADGFSISLRASSRHYCEPRNNEGPYTEVEAGLPSVREKLLMAFAEDPTRPTKTVYGYVPSEVVLEVLLKHGGFISGNLPPMVVASSKHSVK